MASLKIQKIGCTPVIPIANNNESVALLPDGQHKPIWTSEKESTDATGLGIFSTKPLGLKLGEESLFTVDGKIVCPAEWTWSERDDPTIILRAFVQDHGSPTEIFRVEWIEKNTRERSQQGENCAC